MMFLPCNYKWHVLGTVSVYRQPVVLNLASRTVVNSESLCHRGATTSDHRNDFEFLSKVKCLTTI